MMSLRNVFVWLLFLAVLVSVSGTNVQAGHFALAFQRMKPYYENGLGDQFWIWVWDENGNGLANIKLYNSYGTLMGETNYDGQAKIPILAGEERKFEILCDNGQGSTSDVTNTVLTRFYPDWGHYGFEAGFVYKSDVNNPGTFDLAMNGTWPQEYDVNWDEAPYTESLAYHSVDCTDYHSDEKETATWQLPDSYFGQTFVANGDRVISAKVWGVIGLTYNLSWKCQIVTFPGMVPVGPASQTPHEWPFTWMVYWGVNDNPVTPGQTYMLKVWRDEYDPERPGMNMYRTIHNVYPDGILYEGATPRPDKDMWGYVVCMTYGGGDDDDGGYTDSVGLAGYWKLDEGGGDTVTDSSGNGRDGTRQGEATWTKGKVSGGLSLDGAGDYVALGDSRQLKPSLPLTMAAWVKLSETGIFQAVMNLDKKDYDADHRIYGAQLLVLNTGKLLVSYGDGQPGYSGCSKIGQTELQAERWYHVAAVIGGANDISIYVNGQDDGGETAGSGGEIVYSDGTAELGSRSGQVLFFHGCIDDAVLFDVALTPEQIYRLYQQSGRSYEPPCGDILLPAEVVLPGDIDRNCHVNLADYLWLAGEWLREAPPLLADIHEDLRHRVDHSDLAVLHSHWLTQIEPGALGLIGHWRLDDGSGSVAADSSLHGNDGDLYGEASWTAGHVGGALSLDGAGDYVGLGDSDSLKPSLPLTMTAWVKLSETGIFQAIMNLDKKDYDGEHRIYGGQLLVLNTGKLMVSYGDGQADYSGYSKIGQTELQADTWYHVAGVIRGAHNMSLYINGQDDGGETKGAGGEIVYSDGTAELGSRSGSALFLHGVIDDARIYHRALTAAELAALAGP